MQIKISKYYQMRLWSKALVVGLAASSSILSGCGANVGSDPSPGEAVRSSAAPILIDLGAAPWPHGDVNLCFDNTVAIPDQAYFDEAKAQTISALRSSWEKAGRINFKFDEDCSSNPTTIVQLNAVNYWGAIGGRFPAGRTDHGVGFFSYCVPTMPDANCSTTTDNGQAVAVDRLELLRSTAIHELGHALGFLHEHQRHDTPASVEVWCGLTAAVRQNPDSAFVESTFSPLGLANYQGSYDKDSIMNYCRDRDNNQKSDGYRPWETVEDALSTGDERGAETLYGPAVLGPVAGRNLDFFKCSEENGSCTVGATKYVAFGAVGAFSYRSLSGTFSCTASTFGGDPNPGVHKACYYANFTQDAVENGVTHISGGVRDIAFGANGAFLFKRIPAGTAYSCTLTEFGGDPAFGVAKACYGALSHYRFLVAEGQTMTGLANTPVAYGANGKYLFKVLSGTPLCATSTFGAKDPVPGKVKNCYKLSGTFATDEGNNFSVGGGQRMHYGSGLNGVFLTSAATSGSCTNNTFGGDPDPNVPKHCYSEQIP